VVKGGSLDFQPGRERFGEKVNAVQQQLAVQAVSA